MEILFYMVIFIFFRLQQIDVSSPYIIAILVFHLATFISLLTQRNNEKGLAAITFVLGTDHSLFFFFFWSQILRNQSIEKDVLIDF